MIDSKFKKTNYTINNNTRSKETYDIQAFIPSLKYKQRTKSTSLIKRQANKRRK